MRRPWIHEAVEHPGVRLRMGAGDFHAETASRCRGASVGRNRRRRPTGARRATFAAVALMLGGGGLIVANVYASATEGGGGQEPEQSADAQVLAAGAATIDCPDVGSGLTAVPDGAKADVDRELALLDQQIAAAYQQLQDSTRAQRQDLGFADNCIVGPGRARTSLTDGHSPAVRAGRRPRAAGRRRGRVRRGRLATGRARATATAPWTPPEYRARARPRGCRARGARERSRPPWAPADAPGRGRRPPRPARRDGCSAR